LGRRIENTRTVRPTIVEEKSEVINKVEEKKGADNDFHFEVSNSNMVGEDENPFHYANQMGYDRGSRRRSSFAGTNFEKLAQTDEEETELEDFFSSDKLFLVFTNAGKPVFTSHGDIYRLSPIIATLYAIISKIETFNIKHRRHPLESEKKEKARLAKEMRQSQRLSGARESGNLNESLLSVSRLDSTFDSGN